MITEQNNLGREIKAIWLSWEKHRRSQSLASELGVALIEFCSTLPRSIKHPYFLLRTIALLISHRPDILFVQNPSVILTLSAITLRPLFGYKLIVDAHNAGVYPFEKGHEKYSIIFPFMHRQADLTIVTNVILAKTIEKNGGKFTILPDPLPRLGLVENTPIRKEPFIVTLICSYASDEPYLELFKAGSFLPESIKIFVTGNDSKLSSDERIIANKNNVILTGFLSEEEYLSQLSRSDCVIVLTSYLDCMVCGAYEAVALGKPLILSDTPALKWWFGEGALFTNNTAANISENILYAKENYAFVTSQIQQMKIKIECNWRTKFRKFKKILLNKIHSAQFTSD